MKNRRWGGVAWGSIAMGVAAVLVVPGCGGTSSSLSSSSGASGTGGGGTAAGAAGVSVSAGASGVSGAPGQVGANAGGTSGGSGNAGSAGSGGGGAGSGGTLGSSGSGGNAGHGGAAHAGAGSGGHGGLGGTGGTGNTALGLDCVADSDCGSGLKCVLPDDATLPGGGPANGLCTRACIDNRQCTAVSAGAGCVDFGGAKYCLEACTQGEPADLSSKCHGRPDMACTSFTSSEFLCSPRCRADAECVAGMFCDVGGGLCVKTKPTGDPVGTPCDPAAVTSTCLGTCLITSAVGITPATGVCMQLCSFFNECMYTGTQPGGLCIGALGDTTPGSLDLGYCEPGCNCPGACAIPGDLCQVWPSGYATYQADVGSAGFCYPNALGSTELMCGP